MKEAITERSLAGPARKPVGEVPRIDRRSVPSDGGRGDGRS
jgi:hypothetical protein